MGRPFAHTLYGITLLGHRPGPDARRNGRLEPRPVRIFRRQRRTSFDARYLRKLELRLRKAKRAAEANRRLALTDPLTGLPNRRHLQRYLKRALASGSRRPVSLAIFDVDDFKSFNDRHGYVAGDRALAAVGGVLSRICPEAVERPCCRRSSRPWSGGSRPEPGDFAHRRERSGLGRCSGFAARLGGDEFVVVFSGTTAGQARDAARRMARTVARHPVLSSHGVTVSFGIAAPDATMRRSAMRRFHELLAAADRDLHRRRRRWCRPSRTRRSLNRPIPDKLLPSVPWRCAPARSALHRATHTNLRSRPRPTPPPP